MIRYHVSWAVSLEKEPACELDVICQVLTRSGREPTPLRLAVIRYLLGACKEETCPRLENLQYATPFAITPIDCFSSLSGSLFHLHLSAALHKNLHPEQQRPPYGQPSNLSHTEHDTQDKASKVP